MAGLQWVEVIIGRPSEPKTVLIMAPWRWVEVVEMAYPPCLGVI